MNATRLILCDFLRTCCLCTALFLDLTANQGLQLNDETEFALLIARVASYTGLVTQR
jgi:hypothetical protein